MIGDPAKSATCRTGWSVELELSLVILARSVSLGRRAPPSRRCQVGEHEEHVRAGHEAERHHRQGERHDQVPVWHEASPSATLPQGFSLPEPSTTARVESQREGRQTTRHPRAEAAGGRGVLPGRPDPDKPSRAAATHITHIGHASGRNRAGTGEVASR